MKAVAVKPAHLWCLDKDAWSFDLQFNPEKGSMELRRSVDWGPAGGGSGFDPWGGPLEYAKGGPDELSFDILFDETMERPDLSDAGANLATKLKAQLVSIAREAKGFATNMKNDLLAIAGMADESEDSVLPWVQKLYRLTYPVHPADHDAATNYQLRPPIVAFVWEEFEFMGAVTSVDVEFLVFNHNGMPKRAKCRVQMRGRAFTGSVGLTDFLDATYTPPTVSDTGTRSGDTRVDILNNLS